MKTLATIWGKIPMDDPNAPRLCNQFGCGEEAMPCFLDDNDLGEPIEWLCPTHAAENGHCIGCGITSDMNEHCECWKCAADFEVVNAAFVDIGSPVG